MESWIESANASNCDFPIQNIPFGVFLRDGSKATCATAIGDNALDLSVLEEANLLPKSAQGDVFQVDSLNQFMASGPAYWRDVRDQLTDLLMLGGNPTLQNDAALRAVALLPMSQLTMRMPFVVSEYTDFYASYQHAFNVGSMYRGPENALPASWLHMPIGYNGRASTVVVSGTEVRRPLGQIKLPSDESPIFSPCRRLDIELEMGTIVGTPSSMGQSITVAEAEEMIFGYVLLNDWSARDIQTWEYQPLGPFQAKSFATTISPWIVTKFALESFRTPLPVRDEPLLPYLNDSATSLYDINLEASLQPEGAGKATKIASTNYNTLYYSAAQQLTHHAIGGCAMRTGDLLGSGTISGPEKSSFGSLLELTWNGTEPLELADGETRGFIEDGDTLTLSGWAAGEDYRIGFGECRGKVLPASAEQNW